MKTNKRLFMLIPMVALFAGCAQLPKPSNSYADKEPVLVGKLIAQRIADNAQEIKNQLELLNRVRYGVATNTQVGNYAAVDNNNDMEARKNQRTTVPARLADPNYKVPQPSSSDNQSHNTSEISKDKNLKSVEVKSVDTKDIKAVISTDNDIKNAKDLPNKFSKKVTEIIWNNKSANELGRSFAAAVGYEFATQKNDKEIDDYNITFNIKNQTIKQALIILEQENSDRFKILVNKNVKIITFVYK